MLWIQKDAKIGDSTDHDIKVGISDGVSFIGFMAHDEGNYGSLSPCHKAEGDIVKDTLQNLIQGSGPVVSS